MTRDQFLKEIHNLGFADLDDDFKQALLEELDSSYGFVPFSEALEKYGKKCWFENEANPGTNVNVLPGAKNEVQTGYYIPKKYM